MSSAMGSLVVMLNANIAKFESAMNRAANVATQTSRGIQSSLDAIPGSIAKVVGAIGGLYAIEKVFTGAIKATDEYRTSVIGIAAGLTNIAKPGQGSFEEVFQRNVAYAKDMYKELERVAAVTPAEPMHMQAAYNQLVQQGYAARLDEADAMGVLVTRIILATQGQDKNIQINQEIRSLMQGQANQGSMLAQELKSRLGPAWADILQKHKEAGDLLKFLASLWPGVEAAGKEYEKTLEAQGTTLMGNLKYLGREGLGGAYDDIVELVKDINSYIREHQEIIGYLQTGWGMIKEAAGGVVVIVSEIASWVKTAWGYTEGLRSSLSAIAKQRADMGVTMGLDVGAGLMGPSEAAAKSQKSYEEQFGGYESAGEGLRKPFIPKGAKPPEVSPPKPDIGKGGGGGGGKGAKDTTEQLEDYIRQLKGELPKAAGDGFGAVEAWYDKAQAKIAKLATSTDQFERAMGVAQEVRVAKNQKVLDDFNKWYFDQTYKATAAEKQELDKRLESVKGHEAQVAQVREVTVLKAQERQMQYTVDVASQTKRYIDSLAGVTTNIEQQNALKMRSLELEQKIADIERERWIRQKEIPTDVANEIRALAALEAQAKKYDLARRGEEEKGSLSGWASSRVRAAQGQNRGVAGMLTGVENFFQNAMTAGIQGVLTKDASKLKEVGKTMVAGFIGELHKKSVTKIFDSLGAMLAPDQGKGGGGGNGNTMQSAATGLNQAAAGLNNSALGFSLNSAQFGLAAGGLLLSGVGIMTNSQALVMAGTVLQVAALAIQTYQMLSATTSAAALTASAVELSVAASALIVAATIMSTTSAIPFFHTGGLIKAHSGYLAHDERLIVAQTGERILSRRQTREYDEGLRPGSQPAQLSTTVNQNTINVHLPNQSQAEIDKFARRLSKSLRRQESRRVA